MFHVIIQFTDVKISSKIQGLKQKYVQVIK